MVDTQRWRRVVFDSRFVTLVAIFGGLIYLVQSILYAHTQFSLLDEGAYLNKGYLFVTGKYQLYQDYGPWTNHMPLAFLIPGYSQLIFGPGLRTGRYLAVVLGLLTVFGLWILSRRLGGGWWGVLTVWAMALNPAIIKLYSLANSQVLAAGMLVWVLVLTLGEDKPLWQILLGSMLAGVMLLTRVNMLPVLALLVLYLFWQHGWRIGFAASIAAGLPVVIGHAIYWPGILRIWAHWLPTDVFTFLKPWGHPQDSVPSWRPMVTLGMRVTSFLHGVRYHFIALVGALSAWLLWPAREMWKASVRFQAAVFLTVLFLVMFLSHMWASLGQNYCVFCFPVYLSFFSGLGLLLVAVTYSSWNQAVAKYHQRFIALVILMIAAGIGFSAHNDLGNQLISGDFVRSLLAIQLPRLKSFQIHPGRVEVWGMIANRYDLSYSQVVQRSSLALRILATTFIGVVVGLMVWFVATRLAESFERWLALINPSSGSRVGSLALSALLLVGLVLSPTKILGGGYGTYDCGGDVIQSYEVAGAHLAGQIPPGSSIYWAGGDSTVPLLYIKGVRIYPAQINGDYSYRLGGEPDALMRYGFWSDELAHRWAQEADVILIEAQNFDGWLRDLVESENYDELAPTPPLVDCRSKSEIHIFQKEG